MARGVSKVASEAWGWYLSQLSRRPVRTQVATSGLLWAAGDCLAQKIDHALERRDAPAESKASTSQEHHLDWKRVFLTSLFGACFVGPVGHFWYLGLDRLARRVFVPYSAKFVAAKVVTDTLVFGPVHLGAFLTYIGLAEGRSWEQVKEELKHDFIPGLMVDGAVWPGVQIMNFKFVPVKHQLLFVNSICLLDSAFLSWFKHQGDAEWKQWLNQLVLGQGKEGVAADSSRSEGLVADHSRSEAVRPLGWWERRDNLGPK